MAVSDEMIGILFLFLFNFLVIRKKNLFMGNMVFMLIGVGLIYIFLGTLYMYVGILITIVSVIMMIYDLFK